jgi:hypothetical protein
MLLHGILFASLCAWMCSGSSADPDNLLVMNAHHGSNRVPATCAQILNGEADNDEKLLLCQLYESSSLLTQLGALVSQGLDRLMLSQGVVPLASPVPSSGSAEVVDASALQEGVREKKKHEYLRFGKRKHEYLRFGKRKHEYLRFG